MNSSIKKWLEDNHISLPSIQRFLKFLNIVNIDMIDFCEGNTLFILIGHLYIHIYDTDEMLDIQLDKLQELIPIFTDELNLNITSILYHNEYIHQSYMDGLLKLPVQIKQELYDTLIQLKDLYLRFTWNGKQIKGSYIKKYVDVDLYFDLDETVLNSQIIKAKQVYNSLHLMRFLNGE